jgi:GNAT superfamily N-acetyltransferase
LRDATVEDAAEIRRLEYVALATSNMHPTGTDWHENYESAFARHLDSGQMRGFVVDHPSEPQQLIAAGLAFWFELIPSPWLVNGRMGYLQWFSVEEEFRNQGIGGQLIDAAKSWLTEKGCTRIQLHANPAAMPLYERAGFEVNRQFPNMWWHSRQ